MLDLRLIRENAAEVEKSLARRNGQFTVAELVKVDSRYRDLQGQWEKLNQRTNEISELFKTGKADKSQIEALRAESKELKSKREEIEGEKQTLEQELDSLRLGIPNLPHESVPDGKDETSNVEIKTWGKIPSINNPKHHWELGLELDVFDFERGVKIAESRFTVLMEMGAKMERALMNFMLDLHSKRGYREVFPPILVNRESLIGTGQLPKFEEDAFRTETGRELFLIP
ncbi:MAG: serine--tRNA ligase, partial [Candidatus Obscuribacterales bacterium]|nr:serine--tRNA ligase [Candidatus Obscuribacterales bacterium]